MVNGKEPLDDRRPSIRVENLHAVADQHADTPALRQQDNKKSGVQDSELHAKRWPPNAVFRQDLRMFHWMLRSVAASRTSLDQRWVAELDRSRASSF